MERDTKGARLSSTGAAGPRVATLLADLLLISVIVLASAGFVGQLWGWPAAWGYYTLWGAVLAFSSPAVCKCYRDRYRMSSRDLCALGTGEIGNARPGKLVRSLALIHLWALGISIAVSASVANWGGGVIDTEPPLFHARNTYHLSSHGRKTLVSAEWYILAGISHSLSCLLGSSLLAIWSRYYMTFGIVPVGGSLGANDKSSSKGAPSTGDTTCN